jgi:hypothetical protein|tara:strand:- start:734 stop:1090 length:357 start_codon:yes stop_codon:yes gene_type:complete
MLVSSVCDEIILLDSIASCVVSSQAGIYGAQSFVFHYRQQLSELLGTQLTSDTIDIIDAGPDHEDYFDAWDEIEQLDAIVVGGRRYSVCCREGDIFLIDLERLEQLDDTDKFWDLFLG